MTLYGRAGSEIEFQQLVSRLERVSKTYVLEISGEKTKLMVNNNNGMTREVQIVRNTLDEVQHHCQV